MSGPRLSSVLSETERSSWSGRVNSGARDPIASMYFPGCAARNSIIADYDARIARLAWGGSSVGRASRSQCEGRGFDSLPLHHFPLFGGLLDIERGIQVRLESVARES